MGIQEELIKYSIKTVILIPVFNDEKGLIESMKYLDKLNPQPTYYIFLENNSNDNTLNVIFNFKEKHSNTLIIRLWFREDTRYILGSPFATIGLVKQILLEKVRRMDIDYAIFIDSDILIGDIDFITKVTECKYDVLNKEISSFDILGGAYYGMSFNGKKYLSALTKYKDNVIEHYLGIHEVYAVGGGCLCLSKKIIMDKRINFYPLIERRTFNQGELAVNTSEDFGYCFQATDNGYKCYLDNTLNIGHYKNEYYRAWTRINGGYIDFEYPE